MHKKDLKDFEKFFWTDSNPSTLPVPENNPKTTKLPLPAKTLSYTLLLTAALGLVVGGLTVNTETSSQIVYVTPKTQKPKTKTKIVYVTPTPTTTNPPLYSNQNRAVNKTQKPKPIGGTLTETPKPIPETSTKPTTNPTPATPSPSDPEPNPSTTAPQINETPSTAPTQPEIGPQTNPPEQAEDISKDTNQLVVIKTVS